MADFVNPDMGRGERCGIPEVVYGEGKSAGELIAIADGFIKEIGRVVITRVGDVKVEEMKASFESRSDIVFNYNAAGGVLVIKRRGFRVERLGLVGILTAGTSDIPVAEEARVILEELGCDTVTVYDVGIAGIHRVFDAVKKISGARVLIVVAGMEGALPSVVSGLVDKVVIAVPSSVGYGTGEGGFSALNTMLNSCTPLAVVNIDNGYGAAALAFKILGNG